MTLLGLSHAAFAVLFCCGCSHGNVPASAVDRLSIAMQLSPQTVMARMAARQGHFMPVALVESQFQALEEPDPEVEPCVIINAEKTDSEPFVARHTAPHLIEDSTHVFAVARRTCRLLMP